MKQNITLSLEKELIQQAKELAVRRKKSVSRLLGDELRRMVRDAEAYDKAKRAALKDLEQGFSFGGSPAGREELHER